ncbi:integral peroxisomal membrane peroxin-domain-containing protein [Panaeolus papilionaceus]|nr:integral peroxisomal membrane peroxin-domain-containing protein [Panaeolus papilionaceus]
MAVNGRIGSTLTVMITDSPSIAIPLIKLNNLFSTFSTFLKLASWHKSTNSFITLILIWFICLISKPLLLPVIIISLLVYPRSTITANHTLQTEHSVEAVVSDIATIQTLLPALPPPLPLSFVQILRVLAFSYVPYFIITLFVSFRVVLAIVLTVLFTWRAPWAIVLRAAVWQSAWVRWCAYNLWSKITGIPLPPKAVYTAKFTTTPVDDDSAPVQSLRFLFTIYENQRWWMGLDWTAALLPGERPSWCSASQSPMNPPNAFSLPADTVVYLPDPNGTDKIKRTATWRWEEPEWKVLVHKDRGALNRVDKPLPVLEKEENAPTTSRLIKAAGRLRESSLGSSDKANANATARVEEHVPEDSNMVLEDPLTDVDGWVYGDNKWEAQSHKGGMGKYTRFRRWTRIAVVFETVERVAANDGDRSPPLTNLTKSPTPESSKTQPKGEDSGQIPAPASDNVPIISNPPESPLRQRLRETLNKSGVKTDS